jgi:hypothetical protein
VDVIVMQVFVSLLLVVGSLILFARSMRARDHEHADRLALLAIEPDDARPAKSAAPAQAEEPNPNSVPQKEERHVDRK